MEKLHLSLRLGSKLLGNIALMSLSLGVSAESSMNSVQKSCGEEKNYDSQICKASKLLANGIEPKETFSREGVKIINVGYLKTISGKHEKQLVVVSYVKSNNFNQNIHYPNKVCSLYVNPDTKKEIRLVDQAIDVLERGSIPGDNPAYQWALKYKIDSEHCHSFSVSGDNKFIVSEGGNWRLSETNKAFVFTAKKWGNDNSSFVLIHRK